MNRHFATLVLCLLFSYQLFGQFDFTRSEIDATLEGMQYIHAFDVNQDGLMDIATASKDDYRLMLFEALGEGDYDPDQITDQLPGANVIKSFDMDQDGDLDIVASSQSPGNHSIWWWVNEEGSIGNGTFIGSGNTFEDFTVLDIDEDGDADVVSVEFSTVGNDGYLSLWRNDDGDFNQVILSDNCTDGREVIVVDLDEDGHLDFVTAQGLGDRVSWWKNVGDLEYERVTLGSMQVCTSIAIEDYDLDGDLDIAYVSWLDDEIGMLVNDGEQEFEKIQIEFRDGPNVVKAHDMDDDGDMDMVAGFYADNSLILYENTGELNFQIHLLDDEFNSCRDIDIADMNGDGQADILGASLSDDRGYIWLRNPIDADEDGYSALEDCDDSNADINPGQPEVPYNGIDDDCDTDTPDDDLDQDGFPLAEDCDDENAAINPDELEEAYNGLDDDCDPTTADDDLDQDGFPIAEDCNDDDAAINPAAIEIPNNDIDENCDGEDGSVGILQVESSLFTIYPNPASQFIRINTSSAAQYRCTLIDLSGKIIRSEKNVSAIPVDDLQRGCYLLEIEALDNGSKKSVRILLL